MEYFNCSPLLVKLQSTFLWPPKIYTSYFSLSIPKIFICHTFLWPPQNPYILCPFSPSPFQPILSVCDCTINLFSNYITYFMQTLVEGFTSYFCYSNYFMQLLNPPILEYLPTAPLSLLGHSFCTQYLKVRHTSVARRQIKLISIPWPISDTTTTTLHPYIFPTPFTLPA